MKNKQGGQVARAPDLDQQLRAEITKRRRAEDRLAELASIVESTDDAIVSKDLHGTILSWNRGAEKIYGYKAEEVIGKSISALAPPERKKEVDEILDHVRHGKRVQQRETVRIRQDGQRIDMSVTVSPIVDSAGVISGASVIGRDITAQKRAAEALRQSEEQYRLLFQSSPLPMWVHDTETLGFLTVNEAAVRHYGYSRREFFRMTIKDIRPPEDIPALMAALERPRHGITNHGVWRHRKKNGAIIHVEVSSYAVQLGERRAEMAVINDVTERKINEERLRQSEERFSKAFRLSPLAITISSRENGRYVDVNDAFLNLLGYTRDEVVGRTVQELKVWADPEDRRTMVEGLDRGGRVAGLETRFNTKSRQVKYVHVSGELVQLEGVSCILAITDDVTEAKHLELQFRQAQKMEAVGRLAGGVAHDFNNVLGVIIGYSELLQERETDAQTLQQVNEIKKAADRASSLTRQLLAFSRQQILQPRAIDLNTVVASVSTMLRRMIGEDVELILHPDHSLGTVKADPGQIEQILMNLAVNARDAMPKGGKLIVQTQNVDLDEAFSSCHPGAVPGAHVELSVSDTGEGIRAEVLPHIFEPFFTTKGPGKGTGLGLSTVYGVVKQSNGYVSVYSEPGRGTSFKIYLPRVDEPATALEPVSVETEVAIPSETILVVEDDPSLRTLAHSFLEKAGYRVLEAPNGREAIETAKAYAGEIHLLLTDLVMPALSGRDLAGEMEILRPQIKRLYISGYTADLVAQSQSLTPKTALLEKPFTKTSLLRAVRSVLSH